MTPAEVREQVAESRRRQGLGPVIVDPVLLDLLAAALLQVEGVADAQVAS